jgi:hypothetical protein
MISDPEEWAIVYSGNVFDTFCIMVYVSVMGYRMYQKNIRTKCVGLF